MPTYCTLVGDTKSPAAVIEVGKSGQNAADDDFGSNISGAAFCLAKPIGGLLVLRYIPTTSCL